MQVIVDFVPEFGEIWSGFLTLFRQNYNVHRFFVPAPNFRVPEFIWKVIVYIEWIQQSDIVVTDEQQWKLISVALL